MSRARDGRVGSPARSADQYPSQLHHPLGPCPAEGAAAEVQSRLMNLRARLERLDKLPEAAAERDIRYLEARLRSRIPVDPASQPQAEVAFRATIRLADSTGAEHLFPFPYRGRR